MSAPVPVAKKAMLQPRGVASAAKQKAKYADDNPPEDQALALSLITVWAMRTGQRLRQVPVSELTAEELIDFWADDYLA